MAALIVSQQLVIWRSITWNEDAVIFTYVARSLQKMSCIIQAQRRYVENKNPHGKEGESRLYPRLHILDRRSISMNQILHPPELGKLMK
jgi:hypothetical protein